MKILGLGIGPDKNEKSRWRVDFKGANTRV